jgi:hypothetical protein
MKKGGRIKIRIMIRILRIWLGSKNGSADWQAGEMQSAECRMKNEEGGRRVWNGNVVLISPSFVQTERALTADFADFTDKIWATAPSRRSNPG